MMALFFINLYKLFIKILLYPISMVHQQGVIASNNFINISTPLVVDFHFWNFQPNSFVPQSSCEKIKLLGQISYGTSNILEQLGYIPSGSSCMLEPIINPVWIDSGYFEFSSTETLANDIDLNTNEINNTELNTNEINNTELNTNENLVERINSNENLVERINSNETLAERINSNETLVERINSNETLVERNM